MQKKENKGIVMKKTVLMTLIALLGLSACNTIQGAGQDLKSAGEGISDGAHKVKEKISN